MTQRLSVDQAADLTRTGDLWLFRGRTVADRAIQTLTASPVNHVGVAIVIDDLPPLMWHAELGKSLLDVWSGAHHRGVQLHDLKESVHRWQDVYRQDAWLRQISPEVGRKQEDAALKTVARLDGAAFPSMGRLATRWLRARDSYVSRRRRGAAKVRPEAAFCAEVVAETLIAMGIVRDDRKAHWFDPGTFWSGEYLPLEKGWSYGVEVPVGSVDPGAPTPSSRTRWR